MHTDMKYVLLDHRNGNVILSSNDKDFLLEKATDFTLNGSGATYSIYEHHTQIGHSKVVTYTSGKK